MKKYLGIIIVLFIISSCGGQKGEKNSKSDKQVEDKSVNTDEPSTTEGVEDAKEKIVVYGKYTILNFEGEDLREREFPGKLPMILFEEKEKLYSTNIGCNQIRGSYEVSDSTIKFTQGMSTMMACNDSIEYRYLKTMAEVNRFEIDSLKLKLFKGDSLKIVYFPMHR